MNEHGRGLGATAEASDKGSEGWKTDEGTRAGPAVGDEPGAAASGSPAQVAGLRVYPLVVGGAAVVILGTAALAAGLGRGELGLESTETERIRPGPVFRDCEVCPQMVVVPAGSYMMGSPASEEGRRDEEGPRHRVTIGYSLAVGVYEVTFDEWDACVEAGECWGYRPSDEDWGRGSRPVINVSWDEAKDYARWLSSETGEAYRLLSEAEWEYVARAGTTTVGYWGESESEQCRYGNGFDRIGFAAYGRHAPRFDLPREPVDCSDGYAGTAAGGNVPGERLRAARCAGQRVGVDAGLLERQLLGSSGRRERVVVGQLLLACVSRRLPFRHPREGTLPFGESTVDVGQSPSLPRRIPCRPEDELIGSSLPRYGTCQRL